MDKRNDGRRNAGGQFKKTSIATASNVIRIYTPKRGSKAYFLSAHVLPTVLIATQKANKVSLHQSRCHLQLDQP